MSITQRLRRQVGRRATDRSPDDGQGHWLRLLVGAIYAVGAMLSLAALVWLGSQAWYPAFDNALIWLRTSDVGTVHTPLLGPYSRFGWEHPGPALFYLLALPLRAMGMRSSAMLVAAFAVATVSAAACAVLVGRRAGARTAVVLCGALAVLVVGLEQRVADPWNPHILVLPFALFVIAAWLWSAGDPWCAVVAVVSGSFVTQCHVGIAIAVATVGAAAVGLRMAWPPAGTRWANRQALFAVILGLLMWAPPAYQQLTSERGNLSAIAAFFSSADPPRLGWTEGLKVAASELVPWGSLIGNQTKTLGGGIEPSPPSLLIFPFGLLLFALGHAWRGRDLLIGRLAVIALATLCATVYGYTQIRGVPHLYLVVWGRVVGMLCVALPVLVLARRDGRGAPSAAGDHGLALAAAFTGLLGTLSYEAVSSELPDARKNAILSELAPAALRALPPGTTVRVVAPGVPFTVAAEGLAVILLQAGRDARLQPFQARVPGEHRCVKGTDVLTTLAFSSGPTVDELRQRPGGRVIAEHDPLSPQDRVLGRTLRDALIPQFEAGGRKDLVRALRDGAEWLPIVAPPTVDRALLHRWVSLAAGDEHRVYALILFAPTAW